MSEDLKTQIETDMVELVEGMRVVDGYWFDWGKCNISDPSKKSRFPYCNFYNDSDEADNEDNACTNTEFNKDVIRLKVWGKPIKRSVNNRFAYNAQLNKCKSDLRRVFFKNKDLSGLVMDITYLRVEREGDEEENRAERPTFINVFFQIDYMTKMDEPSQGIVGV